MISYFIVAYCTFMTNFSSKLKCQFQIVFDQDSFPLNVSLFQVSLLLLNSANCLLASGCWNACFYHTLFTKKFPLFLQAPGLFVVRYFSCVEQTVLPFSFICQQIVAFNTSSIIFLNKSFLHLDADSAS